MSETEPSQNGYKNCHIRLLSAQDVDLITDLIGDKKDKVHPVETTLEGFAAARIGTEKDNKQCWVLVDDTTKDLKAALYTYQDTTVIRRESDLTGRVDQILTTPVTALERSARSVIFYSVASFDNGAGVHLIDGVTTQFEKHSPKTVLSTLSPLRGLGHWAESNKKPCQHIRSNPQKLNALAMEFLMANEDKVQQFHLRNGAYIGDVKLEANRRGSKDDLLGMNVMVNYVYPKKNLRLDNQEAYKLGFLTLAWHLVGEARKNKGFSPTRLQVGAAPRVVY